MTAAYWLQGDTRAVLAEMVAAGIVVNEVVTSPPYWKKRRYMPGDPLVTGELGQEPNPGAFLDNLLDVTDLLWDVLADDGVMFVNLGDTASQSGGAGGDYLAGGWKEGQPAFRGARARELRPKSVCWIPELYGASLAYGRNLLTGRPCRQWVTRPPVTWCKPNPQVGEVIDKFREATELIVFATKAEQYHFDLDAVRLPPIPENQRRTWNQNGAKARAAATAGKPAAGHERYTKRTVNPKGAPPLTWWKIASDPYEGAHFATFPPELCVTPIKAGCPEGGIVLDPFAGSGTTLAVATGHGRTAIGIDLDGRNADLARERVGPLFFHETTVDKMAALLGHASDLPETA